jgi:hypothetical protein
MKNIGQGLKIVLEIDKKKQIATKTLRHLGSQRNPD